MSYVDIIDLSSDEETEAAVVEDVKPIIQVNWPKEQLTHRNAKVIENCSGTVSQSESYYSKQGSSSGPVIGASIDPKQEFSGDVLLSSPVSCRPANEICRQFWKAGEYETRQGLQPILLDGKNHLRVHPKFLHSNATSHKWAFGAVAELLDNAVDEIKKGATFVIVDVLPNIQNGNPALLIQDDGGGMNPESMRRCMSFGFSDKDTASSIGQYGNGFKTSTMRLGADVIVFSRSVGNVGNLTQSIGLLSYTFLRQTGSDDIVVPTVDYEVRHSSGSCQRLDRHGERHFSTNLAAILKWSFFESESDLLKQFDDIGPHGTKIIVFNLWFNDDGVLELDFDSDETDILISGAPKMLETCNNVKKLTQNHIANRLRYSLSEYLSILYLHLPEYFRIILRGRDVRPHKLVNDLRYIECIKYAPNVAGNKEAVFITTIGFLEGAPNLNVHGFSVYHKNRLILPFWSVVNNTGSRGRGVAGVLEANFIKPAHDKQDFEKSTLYFRLETRLKEMTHEYWDYHCHLVGYPNKKLNHPIPSQPLTSVPQFIPSASNPAVHTGLPSQNSGSALGRRQVVTPMNCMPKQIPTGSLDKRRRDDQAMLSGSIKKQARLVGVTAACTENTCRPQGGQEVRQNRKEVLVMMQENRHLLVECIELEKAEKELNLKVEKLKSEIEGARCYHVQLSTELRTLKGS